MTTKIAIIGAGEVGAAAAYALILGSVCGEILLVDIKIDFRDGQVRDLSDATYRKNGNTRVRAGTYKEAGQCDIVVITAGLKRTIDETSTQLIYRNVSIIRSVIESMKPFRPDTILLLVSNPVDLLTTLAQELSGLPASQVFGSGTFLDSVRLRGLLADKIGIAANSIDAYVLGEHGNSQFIAWSIATIAGIPIDSALSQNKIDRVRLANECKKENDRIIKAKGAIAFGIGSVIASICSSILFDIRNVRPVSHFQPELGCSLSLPVVIGRKGLVDNVSITLNSDEMAKLAVSARKIKQVLERIHDDNFDL